MNNFKVIKSLCTNRFVIELLQDSDGRYVTKFSTEYGLDEYTSYTDDFNMASYMFDLKLQDLEGN